VFGLKVLVLNQGSRPSKLDGRHELVHDFVVIFPFHPGLLQAQVVLVLDQLGIVRPHVHHHWQNAPRVESTCSHVEIQLACMGKANGQSTILLYWHWTKHGGYLTISYGLQKGSDSLTNADSQSAQAQIAQAQNS